MHKKPQYHRDGDKPSAAVLANRTVGLGRIVYCIRLIPCEHGPKAGVPQSGIPGWCATRRDLGGGRRVAYFLACEEICYSQYMQGLVQVLRLPAKPGSPVYPPPRGPGVLLVLVLPSA